MTEPSKNTKAGPWCAVCGTPWWTALTWGLPSAWLSLSHNYAAVSSSSSPSSFLYSSFCRCQSCITVWRLPGPAPVLLSSLQRHFPEVSLVRLILDWCLLPRGLKRTNWPKYFLLLFSSMCFQITIKIPLFTYMLLISSFILFFSFPKCLRGLLSPNLLLLSTDGMFEICISAMVLEEQWVFY